MHIILCYGVNVFDGGSQIFRYSGGNMLYGGETRQAISKVLKELVLKGGRCKIRG